MRMFKATLLCGTFSMVKIEQQDKAQTIDAENAGGQIERLYHNSNCALVAGQGEGVDAFVALKWAFLSHRKTAKITHFVPFPKEIYL